MGQPDRNRRTRILTRDHTDGRFYAFCDGALATDKYTGLSFGGWGVYFAYKSHTKEFSGSKLTTTNNEMELEAIRQAMLAALKKQHGLEMLIFSDSDYALCCVQHFHLAWERNGRTTLQGTPVKNKELIQEIVALRQPWMKLHWVKGHSGLLGNVKADQLAVEARQQLRKMYELDTIYAGTTNGTTENTNKVWT